MASKLFAQKSADGQTGHRAFSATNGQRRTCAVHTVGGQPSRRTIAIGRNVYYVSSIYNAISRATGSPERMSTRKGRLENFLTFVGASGRSLAQFDGKRIYIGGSADELKLTGIPTKYELDMFCMNHNSDGCSCEQFTYDRDMSADRYRKLFAGLGLEKCLALLRNMHECGLDDTEEYILLRTAITDNNRQKTWA